MVFTWDGYDGDYESALLARATYDGKDGGLTTYVNLSPYMTWGADETDSHAFFIEVDLYTAMDGVALPASAEISLAADFISEDYAPPSGTATMLVTNSAFPAYSDSVTITPGPESPPHTHVCTLIVESDGSIIFYDF